MRKLWIVALFITSFSAAAQTLEDVIYKKDGSVLRGTLVEQDFENGRYKIQLQGGSLFRVDKADIEKITKEAPFVSSDAKSDGINININNNPSISQNPVIEQSPTDIMPLSEKRNTKSVFYIGTMGKSLHDEDETFGEYYRGLNLAYQVNASEHIAIYTAVNFGSRSTVTIGGTEYDSEPFGEVSYHSFELNALLSSNNYKGWQFYTGLGLFSEKFSPSIGDSDSFNGSNFILGMGYSWQTLQVQIRTAINNSSDYNDEHSHSLTNLQLGFNF